MEEERLLVTPMRTHLNILFLVIFLQLQAEGFYLSLTTTNITLFAEQGDLKCCFSMNVETIIEAKSRQSFFAPSHHWNVPLQSDKSFLVFRATICQSTWHHGLWSLGSRISPKWVINPALSRRNTSRHKMTECMNTYIYVFMIVPQYFLLSSIWNFVAMLFLMLYTAHHWVLLQPWLCNTNKRPPTKKISCVFSQLL